MFGKGGRSAKEDVAELRGEIERLDRAAQDLEAAQVGAREDVARAKEEAATAVLDAQMEGRSADVESDRLTAAMARVEAIGGAIRQAAERRRDAQRRLLLAQAREARETAGELRAEAERREKITADLLSRLLAHEGCEYAPAMLRPKDGTFAMAFYETRTAAMRREAREAETRAAVLEQEAARLTAKA